MGKQRANALVNTIRKQQTNTSYLPSQANSTGGKRFFTKPKSKTMKALDQIKAFEAALQSLEEVKEEYDKAVKKFIKAANDINKIAIQHPKLSNELMGGLVERLNQTNK
jgi:hypothetical protein